MEYKADIMFHSDVNNLTYVRYLTRFRAISFWPKKVHFSKIQSGRADLAIAALDRLISKYDAAQNLAALVPFVGN